MRKITHISAIAPKYLAKQLYNQKRIPCKYERTNIYIKHFDAKKPAIKASNLNVKA